MKHTWKETRKRLIKKHWVTKAEIVEARKATEPKKRKHRHVYNRCRFNCAEQASGWWVCWTCTHNVKRNKKYCRCRKRKP